MTTMTTERIDLQFPEEAWRPNEGLEDPLTRLCLNADVTINGCSMHVDAVQVRDQDEIVDHRTHTVQQEVGIESVNDLDLLGELTGADGRFGTVELFDRLYVIYLTPHCD